MAYAIKYFRDPRIVSWYRKHGVDDKPVGYVIGKARYESQLKAQRAANHINSLNPLVPVTVVFASR